MDFLMVRFFHFLALTSRINFILKSISFHVFKYREILQLVKFDKIRSSPRPLTLVPSHLVKVPLK